MIINVAFAIPPTSVKFTHWHDGFTEAMGLLADRYEVRWLNVHPLAPQMKKARRQLFDCDFLLVKSNFGWIPDMAYIREAAKRNVLPRTGLMISGSNPPRPGDIGRFDVLFYETTWMAPFVAEHPLTRRAFGIDTDTMHPPPEEIDRQIDWLMVGRPASFKHPERLMERTGRRLLIGEIAGAVEAVDRLQVAGVEVRDFVAYSELAEIYRQTRVLLIAADLHGGGERAIWEARSCGCEVELLSDNPKLQIILDEPVLSHVDYAAALAEGITAALAAPTPFRTAARADFAARLRVHRRSTLATQLRRLRR